MTLVATAGPTMSGMGGMRRVDFSLHSALTAWQNGPFALLVLVGVIMAAYWYLRADWMLSARGRRWPWTRTAAFLAGLAAVDLALQSPVATFTGTYFQAHVMQHLLLMVVAPPLLALGAPSTLLLQTAKRRTKERWLRVLRSPAAAVITHPITVWCLYFGLMFAFFLSSLINVAMHHMALMDLLNLLFLFGGTLYWWPMVGLDPIIHWKMGYGARMVNILLGGPPEVILGLAILSLRVPIASMYSLSSTHAGGALLWISTEFVVIAAFMPIFWQWMRSDERAAARLDAQTAPTAVSAAVPSGASPPAPSLPSSSGPSSAGPARAAPVQPAVRKPVPTANPDPAPAGGSGSRGLTLWEAAWLARTGRIPIAGADSRWAAGANQPASNPED